MKQIPLTQGQFAIVDDEDFEYLNQWKWYAQKDEHTFYAQRRNNFRKMVRMHRIIMDASDEMQVDHIDGNGLRNLRENLRVCTISENRKNLRMNKNNTSGFKGVYFSKDARKFRAQIQVDRKIIALGYYDTVEEGAIAYDEAARKYFGDFASLNYP